MTIASQTQSPSRLLIVDDNEMNRDMLSRRLERRGYTVATAEDGYKGLDILGRERFDLVLLDIMMPGIDGYEVLKTIRQTQSPTDLAVIMATARDQTDDITKALELGANDYVTKPINFPVALARIQNQLLVKQSVDEIKRLQADLQLRNAELEKANARMRHDLQAAAKIQQAFLPVQLPEIHGVQLAWAYQPCETLAGDMLGVFLLDNRHVAIYVLDVSGHGVPAALLSVTLSRFLSPSGDSASIVRQLVPGSNDYQIASPATVGRLLNERFPCDENTGQFFTMFYGVLDIQERQLRYISAGHPSPIYVPTNSSPQILEIDGFPIGIGDGQYEESVLTLNPGDRLYLLTDGVTEAQNEKHQQFGETGVTNTATHTRSKPLGESVRSLMDRVQVWSSVLHDDISILAIEVTAKVPVL